MSIHNKIHWDVEQLRQLYEVEGKTVAEIGRILGHSSKGVNKACKRLGIRMRRRGPKGGDQHTGWKGGVTTDKAGYILRYLPEHPNCNSNGYVREHRLVMEMKLGRFLERNEVVHHIDGNTANNHPDNLEVFESNGKHLAKTRAGKTPRWTTRGIIRMIEGAHRKHLSSLRRRSERDAGGSSESSRRSTG